MILSDDDRESAIRTCAEAMKVAAAHELRRYWWSQFKNLVDGRSAEQVARMEIEKGFAA